MSVKTAQEFIVKVQNDEPLRADVIGLGQDYNALIQLAAKHGYMFTAEDLQTAAQTGRYETGQRLNAEDLSQVVGAGNTTLPQITLLTQRCQTQWTEVNGCC
jgi:predicted ribosomally synthesized peptide with nif11-like leader